MNRTHKRNVLSFLLCAVLIAAMALSMMGCNDTKAGDGGDTAATTTTEAETPATTTTVADENEFGTGAVTFTFTVTDKAGAEETFTIHTDKETVGDALLEHGLIAGEEGAYGLYVKTVNGITADYDTDGTYWAFYVNGEYAASGVDQTAVTAGATYGFKVEG